MVRPDGVAPSQIICVSASVNLLLHHKVQKFSSGTGSPGWSRKKFLKTVVVWWLSIQKSRDEYAYKFTACNCLSIDASMWQTFPKSI